MSRSTSPVPLHAIKTKEMASSGFSVINLSGVSGKSYDTRVPHRHTFYELLYFTGGSGSHEIDFQTFPIEKDSVHFVSPGQIHQLIPKNVEGYVVCFSEDFVALNQRETFLEKFPIYNHPGTTLLKLGKEKSTELKSLIETTVHDLEVNKHEHPDIFRSYLTILLLKLNAWALQSNHTQRKPSGNNKVLAFKQLVNENFVQDKRPSSYAQRLNMSANHLNALCKKHEGKTAIQLIQDRMLLESKRLLYATDLSIKEISYEMGFEDVAYFNRFFKKFSRLTPLEYRKKQRVTIIEKYNS